MKLRFGWIADDIDAAVGVVVDSQTTVHLVVIVAVGVVVHRAILVLAPLDVAVVQGGGAVAESGRGVAELPCKAVDDPIGGGSGREC